jgi:hypothetical protein
MSQSFHGLSELWPVALIDQALVELAARWPLFVAEGVSQPTAELVVGAQEGRVELVHAAPQLFQRLNP